MSDSLQVRRQIGLNPAGETTNRPESAGEAKNRSESLQARQRIGLRPCR